ncbi:hypothetical protein Patl1_10747 [Pistacia atlantica]|uniref:Uncharacterized protein n=1 Tax=Pistacia atlantica TaxID=434234 RepID=A0ACC1A908_9ROSI|nr:hypothetical protein Patl1_10747 [Pistacia atlantica]
MGFFQTTYYSGYTPYANSGDPYGYKNTGYPGSYPGPASYSGTYYHLGDYQKAGSYPSSSYNNQTNSWNEGSYANYNSHQYSNYPTEATDTYNSSTTIAPSLQYPQHRCARLKMTNVGANQVGGSFGDANGAQKNVFDLGAFVGDLTFEEDASGDDISLEGLEKELEECKNYDVVENIFSKGTTLREYTKGIENDLQQVKVDSIQDYIKESDNLVSLHDQIGMPFCHRWRLFSTVFRYVNSCWASQKNLHASVLR